MNARVSSLGYIVIESSKPNDWRQFGTNILGMMAVTPSAADDSTVYLKMDERPYRYAIQKGQQERYLLSGWELPTQASFEQAKAQLKKAGIAFKLGSDQLKNERCVRDLISLQDPAGNQIELYWGGGLDYAPFVSPLGVSAFVTGDDGSLGLGHVVLTAEKIAVAHKFYTEVLGFADSDSMTVPNPSGSVDPIYFMHCNNPRHHSLALYGVPAVAFPTGCVHAMVEVPTVDEVGACLDRVTEQGIHIFSTLGRHSNDHMLSFYMMTPSGFALEYGCQGRTPNWETFTPTTTTGRGSIWGHAFQMPDGA